MKQSLRVAPAVKTIEKLSEKIQSLGLEVDTDIIRKAYQYSKKAHEGQKRQSGEPYISHPLSVAEILVNLQMDQESIITALLHDVVEDTPVTIENIQEEFGSNVSFLVDGVTKISRMNFQNLHHKQSENIRKMIVAMGKDVRVILVKLADRLHNLRTLKHLPEEKRVRIAEETLDVYAPLASRLGMNSIKTEMEDLSFKHFNPQAFSSLKKKMSETEEERGQYMEEVIHQLDEQLRKFMKTKYEIQGRYKNFWFIPFGSLSPVGLRILSLFRKSIIIKVCTQQSLVRVDDRLKCKSGLLICTLWRKTVLPPIGYINWGQRSNGQMLRKPLKK